jgi:Lysine-specific metallo-endopeptidase/Hemopexin
MPDDLRQSIHMQPTYRLGEPVTLRYEVENTGGEDYSLLTWDTPLGGEVMNFLEVRHEGRAIPYDGRLVKRGEPSAESYRTIAAGETVVEELDLSESYALEDPGTYTVTLDFRYPDAIRGSGHGARRREEHEAVRLEPHSATFELVPDGEPRLTRGQRARAREAARSRRGDDPVRDAAENRLTMRLAADPSTSALFFGFPGDLSGLMPDWFEDAFAASDNMKFWLDATIAELGSWSLRTDNTLYTDWFGADDLGRYQAIRSHFATIRARLETPHTYEGSMEDCPADAYAYTHPDSDTIWLCSGWFSAPATGRDSKFGVFVHEWSHAVAGTDDIAYGFDAALDLARTRPQDAVRNADNHEYMVEMLADRMLTAPVMWPNGKMYVFVAGRYFRYDVATDRVDPGYPLPIAGNWPGLWGDGIQGGVVWNNGKAYFFRGWQYVRYDIAADRADGAYPRAIAENWPFLWGENLDAAVFWPNGKGYFFRGSEYMRYDNPTDRVDPGYPLPIAGNWPGLWGDRVDSGVVWPNGKAYFFRDSEYMRYDIATDRVDPGYPLPIADNWPGLGPGRVDAVVVWPNNKAYFFRGDQYLRYDIVSDKVDDGYPLPIGQFWPGLGPDPIDAAVVWNNGKAYFFRDNWYWRWDLASDTVDPNYPSLTGWNWPWLPGRVR